MKVVRQAHGVCLENRSQESGESDFHTLIVRTTHGVCLESGESGVRSWEWGQYCSDKPVFSSPAPPAPSVSLNGQLSLTEQYWEWGEEAFIFCYER